VPLEVALGDGGARWWSATQVVVRDLGDRGDG
jgi:hypothetical protein